MLSIWEAAMEKLSRYKVPYLSHPDSRFDPIGGSEPSSGCETIYWDSLPDFFFKPNWYLWVWLTSYNRIKLSYTYQKNYHQSGVHQNLYTFTECYIQIQHCTFTFTNKSTEPTCSEPLQVCWPSSIRKSSDVFSCTYTD